MYFAQLNYETGNCFLVGEEDIVRKHGIKFRSDIKKEVVDFCEKWNQSEKKYYVYDTGNGLGGIATRKKPDCKLIDIFTDADRAKKCMLDFIKSNVSKKINRCT